VIWLNCTGIGKLKAHLTRKRIPWKPTTDWSLIFSGNHPEGLYIDAAIAPIAYINKLPDVKWDYRGNYSVVYVYPKRNMY
jgi:hypothetical protein